LVMALKEVFGAEKGSRFVDVSRIPLLCASVINTNKAIEEINSKLDEKYVTKESFVPIQYLVYGLISMILVAVIGALLTLVVVK